MIYLLYFRSKSKIWVSWLQPGYSNGFSFYYLLPQTILLFGKYGKEKIFILLSTLAFVFTSFGVGYSVPFFSMSMAIFWKRWSSIQIRAVQHFAIKFLSTEYWSAKHSKSSLSTSYTGRTIFASILIFISHQVHHHQVFPLWSWVIRQFLTSS